jgi:hypothetical protein
MGLKNLFFAAALICVVNHAVAATNKSREDAIEVGFERMWATVPYERAIFSGLLLNYYFSEEFYFGTNQSALSWKGNSEYRPDLHFGLLFPLWGNFAFETTLGMDFFTFLIIALALAAEDDNLDYKFVGSFYSPYVTCSTALRYEYDAFALKLLSQIQFGGYFQTEHSPFNASIWLGLGLTYRFKI